MNKVIHTVTVLDKEDNQTKMIKVTAKQQEAIRQGREEIKKTLGPKEKIIIIKDQDQLILKPITQPNNQ